MNSRIFGAVALTALTLTACADGAGGFGYASLVNPQGYLREYPMGDSKEQVLQRHGVPDLTTKLSGIEVWQYSVRGSRTSLGSKRWAVHFKDNRVYNVFYYDGGPISGSNTRALRSTLSMH